MYSNTAKFMQAKEARKEAIDNMDPKLKNAFENIQFYKFYPVNALDAPELSIQKVCNNVTRYFRMGHKTCFGFNVRKWSSSSGS